MDFDLFCEDGRIIYSMQNNLLLFTCNTQARIKLFAHSKLIYLFEPVQCTFIIDYDILSICERKSVAAYEELSIKVTAYGNYMLVMRMCAHRLV